MSRMSGLSYRRANERAPYITNCSNLTPLLPGELPEVVDQEERARKSRPAG